jgi:hypothetical protein
MALGSTQPLTEMSTRNISCGVKAVGDNLTTFKCQLSRNPGASTSWNPKGLSRPVMGLLYLTISFLSRYFFTYFINFSVLYWRIYCKVLTSYNDLYTATREDWGLNPPIQYDLTILTLMFILCTLITWRRPPSGRNMSPVYPLLIRNQ